MVILSWKDTAKDNSLKDGTLNAGVIEINGNFIQKNEVRDYYGNGNFSPKGSHKVILSGTKNQLVTFENINSNRFNILEIKNNSGQIIIPNLKTNELSSSKDAKLKVTNLYSMKLTSDININSTVYIKISIMIVSNLNNHKLEIMGNVIHSGGTIYVNKGKL